MTTVEYSITTHSANFIMEQGEREVQLHFAAGGMCSEGVLNQVFLPRARRQNQVPHRSLPQAASLLLSIQQHYYER